MRIMRYICRQSCT